MDAVWSQYIQGCMTLYASRRLRFRDRFRDRYLPLLDLPDKPLRILEIGCGPGALAQALKRWYPAARVRGVDRDSAFVAFARDKAPALEFLEGDALALPFEAARFDAAVSYTVSEHVAPEGFFGEQRRVLKKGGVCLVLSVNIYPQEEAGD